MRNTITALIVCLLAVYCMDCNRVDSHGKVKVYELPATVDDGINVVVEIPAGTNHKIEFNTETKTFENDRIDDKIRVINFLPYPGNYGFIPSTYMDPERGGDGDALDILVICESVPSGTVLSARPIAALQLKDRGEIDTKIIAVPLDSALQVISPIDFQEFLIEYDAAKRIIEEWFLSYKGLGVMEFIGWKDDRYAWEEINKWKLK